MRCVHRNPVQQKRNECKHEMNAYEMREREGERERERERDSEMSA